jgi:sugar O-acyltransferase (sialic acid O-acetyltransferase NeuD family)
MQQDFILGAGENVLSLILETFCVKGHKGPFTIVLNVPVDIHDSGKFLPDGLSVKVLHAVAETRLSLTDRYYFGVASPRIKEAVFCFFRDQYGIEQDHYGSLVHPSAVVAGSSSSGNGLYVEPLSVVSPFARIGFGVTVNRQVSVGHHSVLEDFVTLGPGVNIAGNARVGEGTQLGIGAVVFNGVSIGKNTVIGGGSIVTKDIPDNAIAWGNPCRVVKATE